MRALQPRAVEHRDAAARIADQAQLLQLQRAFGDALAAHAQHVGDQFLRHHQLVAVQPVQAQQQPAAQLLVQRVVAVAHRGLRHLRDQRLRVAQQQVHHRAGAFELVLDDAGAQAPALARALHHGAAGRGLAAHEQRDADHAFVADHRNLGRRAVLHHVQQRDDGRGREVHMAERAARLVQHLAERQVDPLEQGLPALPFGGRQGGQQVVFARIAKVCHGIGSGCGALRTWAV